jgi:hypothetical protein
MSQEVKLAFQHALGNFQGQLALERCTNTLLARRIFPDKHIAYSKLTFYTLMPLPPQMLYAFY